MAIHEKLVTLRKTAGMNRKQFSAYLGVPYDTIASWETGKRHMPEYVYDLIAFKMAALTCAPAQPEPQEPEPGAYEQISLEEYLSSQEELADTRNDFMPWITREEEELRALRSQGMNVSQIAARLQRSEDKVAARMKRLRIK